jgi:hypothetical protein
MHDDEAASLQSTLGGIFLTQRNKVLWSISIAAAGALTASGIHAKNLAELNHREAGLYRQMPGIIVGLLSGFFLNSPVAVVVVTIAVNVTVYYFVLRFAMWVWRKAIQ